MPKGREYELKFNVAPAAARLTRHPALADAGAEARCESLVSTYYDTAQGTLRRQGVTLRVRTSEHQTVHTLKRSGVSLMEREEWEREGDDTLEHAWLRTTPLAALFAEKNLVEGLDPRFTVHVDRTILPISYDGTTIEGAVDQGSIRAGAASLPVHEFELEYKDGPEEGILRLGRKLARDLPLVLSLTSKAERGFALADSTWGHPSKSIPLDLARVQTLRDLFTAVVQGCLHALCRNAALIGSVEDGEAVHKTRIALRHIRAALALFRPVLRRRRLARLKGELKWMSDKLGAARDADVFRQLAGTDAGGSPLADVLEPRRRRSHERLEAALASARWRLLLIDILTFSIHGVRRSQRARCAPAFARHRVRRLRRALAGDARGLCSQPAEALHDLRKRAKMLRYDLDLVGDLGGLDIRRKHLRHTGDDLQALQETLGEIHDAEALAARLQESILSRHAPPKNVAKDDWSAVVGAARTLCAAEHGASALRKAAKAGRRLRRRAF